MTKRFIIIEPDPVVCMDVGEMLIAEYPTGHVTQGASLVEIGGAINNCGPDTTLFVRGSLIAESDDLGRVVQTAATRQCHVVIMGEAEGLDVPATFIELPFTTDMVIAAVSQGDQDGGMPAPD